MARGCQRAIVSAFAFRISDFGFEIASPMYFSFDSGSIPDKLSARFPFQIDS
jgi:hypothetical protein